MRRKGSRQPKASTPQSDAQRGAMQILQIETLESFGEFRDDWNRVYAQDPDAPFFLSHNWLSQWLPMLSGPWVILAAKPADSPHVVAFMPLRIRIRESKRGELFNEINMAGNYQADYTGFISVPECDHRAIPAFARHVGKMHWTRIHLENIRTTEDRLRLFLSFFPAGKFSIKPQTRINKRDNIDNTICPFARLPEDWDAYLDNDLSANTRQKIRRFMRQVESSSEFRVTCTTAETVDRDVDILLQFWARKWGPRKGNRLAGILSTNRELLTHSFAAGILFMPVFWRGDEPLGALAIFVDEVKKAFLFYMAGRDETFNSPPPGLILHAYSIRHAIRNGFRTYDFLRGNESYKYSLATEERRIACLVVSTRNGRNLGDRLDIRTLPGALDRATDLHTRGRFKEAERAYGQIIRTDPQHAKALYYLGQLKASTGSHGAAKRIFKSLVAVKPEAEKAWLRLGSSLEAKQRFAEAVDAYREVIKQQPALALAHNKLGGALFKLGRYDDAIAAFDEAIALQANYLEAEVSRDNILHMLGRLPRDRQQHCAALNVQLGDKFMKAGRSAFAVHCYKQALKMDPELVPAHYGLAQAMQAQGDNEGALRSYRRVIDIDPDHAGATACIASLSPAPPPAHAALHANP